MPARGEEPAERPDPGIESASPVSPAWAGEFFSTAPPRKPQVLELGIAK